MNGYDFLTQQNACLEALEWAEGQRGKTLEEAYNACPRSDWLFWILADLQAGGSEAFRSALERWRFAYRTDPGLRYDPCVPWLELELRRAKALRRELPWSLVEPEYLRVTKGRE
jgi:hypothetical protein